MAKPEQTFDASTNRVFEALLVALARTKYSVVQSDQESGAVSFRTGIMYPTGARKNATFQVGESASGGAVARLARFQADGAVFQVGFNYGEGSRIARKIFAAVQAQLQHDSQVPPAPSASAVLGGFTVVGGSGLGLAPSSVCTLSVRPEALDIMVESPHAASVLIPYREITALELGGGQKSGGFLGGGFGLQGAAEGMAVASVLNSLTSSINTMLRIGSTNGEVVLHHGRQSPESIRNVLSPLWIRYEAAQRAASTPASEDPVALLQRLGELHGAGVLSDEEFQAKKKELLARM